MQVYTMGYPGTVAGCFGHTRVCTRVPDRMVLVTYSSMHSGIKLLMVLVLLEYVYAGVPNLFVSAVLDYVPGR